ncbi:MAG TPA: HAMP domain-containing histidine kinase [Candidatus Vogelbacteria bacterium]|nr:HAMP domain-containing histidine kinase [Candidatus Vogelbacteria bacterium]
MIFILLSFFISYNYETIKPIYIVKRILKKKDSHDVDKRIFPTIDDTKINEKLVSKMNKLSRVLYTKDLEIKMLKKQLANLDQAKSKFISVTTHQMRTPLSAIKWTLNMILSGQLGEVPEEQKEFLQKGYDSTQKMIVIVNNLLNLNQRESLRDDYSFSLVEIEELIKDTMSEFVNQVESKKIDFVFKKSAGQIPKIEVDIAKIKMVLENLFDNAIKYTSPGGQVVVTLSDKNLNIAKSQVVISVKDSGIGIPEEEQKKIFHKFFRASNAVLQEPDGSGIGLYISKDIVEKHHGTLWFESQVGKGTTFHLLLPLNQVESDGNEKVDNK